MPVNPALLRHHLDRNHNYAIQYVNALLNKPNSEESNETNWFLFPQEAGDENQQTPKQKCRLKELIAFQNLDLRYLQHNQESCEQFLCFFDWTAVSLDSLARHASEDYLVGVFDIFTSHWFDTVIISDSKLKKNVLRWKWSPLSKPSVMPAWGKKEISTYPYTYGIFIMYEFIIITRI